MKIWVQSKDETLKTLEAFTGGISRGVAIDGTIFSSKEEVGSVAVYLEAQNYIPVVRVQAALGMKRLFNGLCIIHDDFKLKTKLDSKVLLIVPDGTKHELDHAIEKVLEFYKKFKIKSPV